ncbi:MAG: phosphotransferase family protein [Solirubrobacteraceae bacterium]|nr:phosphotransferase family protein [Solirubrobacteraceae bacterium]
MHDDTAPDDAPTPHALRAALADALGDGVTVADVRPLTGGASRELWALRATVPDGAARDLVLRRDPPGDPGPKQPTVEAALLRAAADAGVPVPDVVGAWTDGGPLGSGGLIMELVPGEAAGRRIVRDDRVAPVRERFAERCGEILAAIHRIPVDAVPGLERQDPIAGCRALLDGVGEPHPALEVVLRRLERNRPDPGAPTVVHGDFRVGNLLVEPDGIRAVLDWELAYVGDPLADLGWLCVRAWRFGGAGVVGGIGDADRLLDAYHRAGGRRYDRRELGWSIALQTARWGALSVMQAGRHLSGATRSIELAAIGRRTCEQEWDALVALDAGVGEARRLVAHGAGAADDVVAGGVAPHAPHDRPDVPEILRTVREHLEAPPDATDGSRARYERMIAVNLLGVAERQLPRSARDARDHAASLRSLGVADDAALVRAIRAGDLDDRDDELLAWAERTVRTKLAVASPGYDD